MSQEDAYLPSDRIPRVDSKGFGSQLSVAFTTALVCACDFSHCQARCRFVSLNAFVEREK
jgi:hypothetical protein